MADRRTDPKRTFRSAARAALNAGYAESAGDEALRLAWTETLQATETTKYESARTSSERGKTRLRKVWFTQGDSRVRDDHVKANGTSRFVNHQGWGGRPGKFLVGGEYLRHPRDPNGSPGNIINCRCFMEYRKVRAT